MLLRTLDIKNYLSLEHVRLEKLGLFNVLIGRNNAGKSAVFRALSLVNECINGGRPDGKNILTAQDTTRSFEVTLTFSPRDADRQSFIDVITDSPDPSNSDERLQASETEFIKA